MKIIIARHGEAETTSLDGTDRSRPLTAKGEADVRKMGNFLKLVSKSQRSITVLTKEQKTPRKFIRTFFNPNKKQNH